jgi:dTDP-glucose pyrophosphorylase
MNHNIHLILSGRPIKEALIQMSKLGIDIILFVVDENNKLIGSVTDGDIRRGLIKGISIDDPVDFIIKKNPRFILKGERDIKKIIKYRDENLRIVPLLDKDNKLINVINFREIHSYLPIDAVLMAGGRGQRLMPLTNTTPKSLLKVGDKPIIEHNLNRLLLYGVQNFWISINYLGNQIIDYFGNGDTRNININYVNENKPLGTIGAVSQIDRFEHDYILISNSDLLTNMDYEHFFLEFLKADADLAVVTIPYQVNIPYAVLETSNGFVSSFKEKPSYTYYSNGGIYFVKREILNLIPRDSFFNTTDLIEKLLSNGGKVYSYPMLGYWLDIGSPEDYKKAQLDITSIIFNTTRTQ